MVPFSRFQVVTGYTQAALLAGRCMAGVLGQVLVATELCDYYSLNFISLASVSVATVVACFLPSVDKSIYFHRGEVLENVKDEEQNSAASKPNEVSQSNPNSPPKESVIKRAFKLIWLNFKTSFSDLYLLKWSLWWAFAMCGYFQVLNYIQPLWETVGPSGSNTIYNGAVEALHTFLSKCQ